MIEKIGNFGDAISGLAAAITLILIYRQYKKQLYSEELRNWQKVIAFNMIVENSGIKLSEIQSKYIDETNRLQTFKIRKEHIQNDELDRVLMELMKDGLIKTETNQDRKSSRYFPVNREQEFNKQQFMDLQLQEIQTREERIRFEGKILEKVRNKSGELTIDKLIVELQKEFPTIENEFYALVIHSLVSRRVVEFDIDGEKIHWKAKYDGDLKKK